MVHAIAVGRKLRYRTKGCLWAIVGGKPQLDKAKVLQTKTGVRTPRLSADQWEHSCVWCFGAGCEQSQMKPLAICNHDFEVASLSRRKQHQIAISQLQGTRIREGRTCDNWRAKWFGLFFLFSFIVSRKGLFLRQSPGVKSVKKYGQAWKSVKSAETILPFSCCPLVFLWKNRTPTFFISNFSGTPGISRQNPGISRQKVWFHWASKDILNFLAPSPSRWRPPPHPKTSGPKSLGLGSVFFPEMIDSAKTWCLAKTGLFISCTQGGL